MLGVAFLVVILITIMLNVVIVSVVAPKFSSEKFDLPTKKNS